MTNQIRVILNQNVLCSICTPLNVFAQGYSVYMSPLPSKENSIKKAEGKYDEGVSF